MDFPDGIPYELWLEKVKAFFADVDWAAFQEQLPDLAQCGDFFSAALLLLGTLLMALVWLAAGLLLLFLLTTFYSVMVALASFISCWLFDRGRTDAPQPAMLSYLARNICNSLLFIPLINGLAVAMVLNFVLSLIVSGGSGHPPFSLATFIPIALLILAVPPLFFLLFARFGMRFSLGRCFAALLCFTALAAVLTYVQNMLVAALGGV